ncbi:MAG: ABC transporter permease [Mesorhizobium sp.]|uniref:ABC transporter permease n=1 Tax=Mesorhizobium sp. TaxID=1871066 RepID=UPI001208B248|nr:ABC transporter permease [Mesorhizobium sp.]TIQ29124.1 MAG: ABC transporter permease [Mesorhizobium sp.]
MDAIADITEALQKHHLATTFGWQDILQRYRRSRVGAFWLTINMGVMIGALGVIFGALLRSPMQQFLPYICAGLIVWGFISSSLSDGCNSLISAEGMILQVKMPLFTHVMRNIWRNIIIFFHNIIIFPFVVVAVAAPVSWTILLGIPGFVLICLNLLWMMLILGIICARFRDMNQVVQNLLQVLFYVTPLMWMPQNLPSSSLLYIIDWNPFFHLIQLVRAPLLGSAPTELNWIIAIGMLFVGWIAAIYIFGRFRNRIAYWL